MELDNKILLLISIMPYQIAILTVMLCFNSKASSNQIIGKMSFYLIGCLSVLFFTLGIIVSLLPVIGSENVEPQHWLSFYLSSMFLANMGYKFRNKQLK